MYNNSHIKEVSSNSRLLAIDGHYLLFRAFFGIPINSNYSIKEGQYTNAVYGFISMMLNIVKNIKPNYLVIAFDSKGLTFRKEQYPEYKNGRPKTPGELKGQLELIKKILTAMNIKHISLDKYEADDILATISKKAERKNLKIFLMSGDRDFLQLVNENVTVVYPRKGSSDLVFLNPLKVKEKYFVFPKDYPILAALVGEDADNLPGIPGVGPKTAAKWIKQYGSFDNIIQNRENIRTKVGISFCKHVENVKRNKKLNCLITDINISIDLENCKLNNNNNDIIENIFNSLNFKTLYIRFLEICQYMKQ